MKKSIFYSFSLNIGGLVALFLIDLQITQTNNSLLISNWALTKSILFIGVLFILLGIDQSTVRLKLQFKDIFSIALVQFFTMTVIVVGLLYLFKFEINFLSVFFSLFFLSVSYLLFATYRLNMFYIKSQLFLQAWKVILLVLLFMFDIYSYSWLLPIALFISIVIAYKKIITGLSISNGAVAIYKKSTITGIHYFFSMATLTASLYFDQLLLNYDGKVEESSLLFAHITFFVSPIAIFLGFAGFILGPYLRNNPEKKNEFFKKVIWIYIVIGVLFAFGSIMVGTFLFKYFKPESEAIFNLSIVLVFVVFLRYLYILPSVYIGSFASNNLIKNVSMVNFIGLIVYLGLYFFISRVTGEYLNALLYSMLMVWAIRVVNGYVAIYKILKGNTYESV